MNIKYEYEGGFMHVYDNCHSLSYVIFNAKITLFDLTLTHNKDISNNVIFALKMTQLSEWQLS